MSRVFVFAAVVVLSVGCGLMGFSAAATADDGERIEFSNETTITEYELEDGEVEFTIETSDRVQVTVTDALAGFDQDGAIEQPQESHDVLPGEQTITMDLEEHHGAMTAGVTVDGTTVRLSSSMTEDPADEAGENPLHYFGGESGLFTGMGMSMVMAVGATGFVLWREEKGVIKA